MADVDESRRTDRDLLRFSLAVLAYRGAKALRGAPRSFGRFTIAAGSRTPVQILAHVNDLLRWAVTIARGDARWAEAKPVTWGVERRRFHSRLKRLDAVVRVAPMRTSVLKSLMAGPVADSLCHVGQINYLRRLAGAAVRGENYALARIVTGTVGARQAAPRREFE